MPKPLWQPNPIDIPHTHMHQFMLYVNEKYQLKLTNYDSLFEWSILEPQQFWACCAEFCRIIFSKPPSKILIPHHEMHKTTWFADAKLNFAQNLLWREDDHIAIYHTNENGDTAKITYSELSNKTIQLAKYLKEIGVKPGDRIAGFVTNCIETVIAMLASASIGAIWTACSPEFGAKALVDRFSQINPTILFVKTTHHYQGKIFSHTKTIDKLEKHLPQVKAVIDIDAFEFSESNNKTENIFLQLPFDHPLYILYSSGTTGKPKCMVHGAGNTLIQHKKELMLHTDLHKDDTIFFYTTCSWMMWHWLVSSLSVGATVVLYDGSPIYPTKTMLFDLIDQFDISIFGCGAKLFETYLKEKITPRKTHKLTQLKTILSTGSPLIKESFNYIYDKVKKTVRVSSISGGSDIISCFALGNPLLPVYPEELQCRGLGMAVEIYDDAGTPIFNEPGELVCTKPFPSMPRYFWNDTNNEKYFNAYFNQFKNTWTHGDYAKITDHNGIIIYGRSDATLNPGGIRIGTADIYEQALKLDTITDCVAAGKQQHGDEVIVLFVTLRKDIQLDTALKHKIQDAIREHLSPFHVPKYIFQVNDIPKTVNGKTMEIAVKNIINGREIRNTESLANPDSLNAFKNLVFKNAGNK